jgi:hypothetical protein
LDQSVSIEIIPFVNKKLARGWNEETKSELLALAKTQPVYQSVKNQNSFSLQFKKYIEDTYSYKEYQQLLAVEKTGVKEDAILFALQKNNELDLPMQLARLEAEKALLSSNFVKAIQVYQSAIFSKKSAIAEDYYNLSICFLATKQWDTAKRLILDGQSLYSDNLKLQLAMADYFLVSDDWKKCKQIHRLFSNQNLDATTEWKKQAIANLELFKKAGLENRSFKKLEKLLQ